MGGGKGSAPDAPDYMALANQSAASALNLAKYNTLANRVNQTNPYGAVKFSQNPDGSWNQASTLSPQQQQIFNSQQGAVQNAYGNANGVLSNPTINLAGLPSAPIHAGQTAQDAIMSRLQPQIERNRGQLDTQLRNQGFTQGSEGYRNAMTDENQRENDLYTQAALQGINEDQQARQQELGIQQAAINTPINAINALRGGTQTGLPSSGISQQALTQPADYLGAAQNSYNAAMNKYNASVQSGANLFNGAMDLGAMALPFVAFSDERLKKDVSRIGETPAGIPVYTFRYSWDEGDAPLSVGVMAHEVARVIPEAVSMHSSGFYQVNYGALK